MEQNKFESFISSRPAGKLEQSLLAHFSTEAWYICTLEYREIAMEMQCVMSAFPGCATFQSEGDFHLKEARRCRLGGS